MKIIVTMELTYPGGKNQMPSKKSLKIIEETIANEIENGGLDLTLGANVQLLESVTIARPEGRA